MSKVFVSNVIRSSHLQSLGVCISRALPVALGAKENQKKILKAGKYCQPRYPGHIMTFTGKASEKYALFQIPLFYNYALILHIYMIFKYEQSKLFIVLSRVVYVLSVYIHMSFMKGCQNGSCAVLLSLFYSFISATLIFKGLSKAFNNLTSYLRWVCGQVDIFLSTGTVYIFPFY